MKRFIIEFTLKDEPWLAHTNNSGAMLGLLREGSRALFSRAANPQRKLPYTLERLELPDGSGWAGVNTLLPNRLLKAAFLQGELDFCEGYTSIKMEARERGSRLDAVCTGEKVPPLWIECKSVTLVKDGRAAFPDAVSSRAARHLADMMELVKSGHRAAMFYLIQRNDAESFGPAEDIDSRYAELFYKAVEAGVEIYPIEATWSSTGIGLGRKLKI